MASISANGSRGHHKFTLNVTETGTSVENNTSSISWSFVLSSLGGGWDWYYSGSVPVTYTVVINGNKYTGNIMNYDGNSTVTVRSGTLTVAHNDDGNKTISFSFSVESINQTYLPGSASASGSLALSFIARASQPSCITYPENTKNVGEFGDIISIHMNRKSSSFTHTVRYVYGTKTGICIDAETEKQATTVENGFKWKIPETLMNEIPNALSGYGEIHVDTYNGSKLIGTKVCGFVPSVPASVKPTVGMTLEDITGVDDIYGSPVKGLSKIKITVNATPAYSSPIASYQITANGVRYSTKEATTGFLTGKDPVITVTATDKRERPNSATYTMNVLDYAPPSISNFVVTRSNKDGSANKRGAFVKVTFSAAVSSMSGKNTAAYSIQYKKTSATAWTPLTTDANGKNVSSLNNNFAPSNQNFVFAADTGNSYDVIVSVVDRHNSSNPATKSAKAPTAHAIFSWRGFKNSSGNKEDGAGIGKVPEKPNCLQVGWDAEFEKELFYKGKTLLDFFYPVGSIYIAYNHTDPGTLFGGIWERMQDGFLWASRSTDIIGQTGGEKTHTLTANELPEITGKAEFRDINNADHNLITSTSGVFSKSTTDWSGSHDVVERVISGTVKLNNLNLSIGGGAAHNNMPPYIQVSMWRRTA